jgi:NTE family protein
MDATNRRAADAPAPAGDEAPRFGLVLSGGGARGAYEAGVLSWVLDELPTRLGAPVRFQILTGTSVGAIHACYVAATAGASGAGRRLLDIWRTLEVGGVYRVGLGDLIGVPLRVLGLTRPRKAPPEPGIPERLRGLLDTLPLERLVRSRIPWADLRRHIDTGVVETVAVAATEIGTGRSIVWVDNRKRTVPRWAHDPFVVARPAALEPAHALASAAIPFLFPALRLGDAYYCDGGLRLNTPLAPALRLGANRLLIVGLRHRPSPDEEAAEIGAQREADYGSLTYLAGKVLNALLLDHVDYDVDRLRVVNAILDTGVRAYGPDFLARMNETVEALRGTPYHVVRNVYLQPSRDLARLALECLRRHRPRGARSWLSDATLRYAVHGIAAEADLLSYLYFDRCYAEHLIELGRADAEAKSAALVEFFRAG